MKNGKIYKIKTIMIIKLKNLPMRFSKMIDLLDNYKNQNQINYNNNHQQLQTKIDSQINSKMKSTIMKQKIP